MANLDTARDDVATDTTPDDDQRSRPAPPSRPRRRWLAVAPWVLAAVAIAAAGYATFQWRQLAAEDALATSARTAAVAFTRDLTTWDASDGLDDEIARLRDQGTGAFLDELQFVFGGDELTSQLRADGVTATGEVQEAFVQDLQDGTAEVFVVVSVSYDSTATETAPDPVPFPATLVLERAEGTWRVAEVSVPNTSQIGELMTPEG